MKTKMVMTDWYTDFGRDLSWWLGCMAVVSLRINDPARYEAVYGGL